MPNVVNDFIYASIPKISLREVMKRKNDRKRNYNKNIAWYYGSNHAMKRLNWLMKSPGSCGGIPKGVKVRVKRGYRIINKQFNRYDNFPEEINGYKVITWIQTYFDEDAEGDYFKPVVRIRKIKRKQSIMRRILKLLGFG
ncbi:MAG: hypothetical protein JW716_04420 [Candidatus Aenigmarchaeota archaeon]|nr:hypothetical protein [Candidatus Aenigmarchaeota archaeon]